MPALRLIMAFPNSSDSGCGSFSRCRQKRNAVFLPTPGSLENSLTAFSSSTDGYSVIVSIIFAPAKVTVLAVAQIYPVMRKFCFIVCCLLASSAFAQSSDSLNMTDSQGRKQGIWKKTYPNGIVRYRGRFADDVPVGEFRYFTETGGLKAVILHQGDGRHSSTRMFDDEGRLQATGFYIGQKKDSVWTMFDAAGHTVAIEKYRLGDPHGEWTTFYAEDSVPARLETWKNGKRNGVVREFFESGYLKVEMYYVDGKANGVVQVWFADGKLNVKGNYLKGKKNGEWFYYTKEGKLRKKEKYDSGTILSQEILIKDDKGESVPLDPSEDPANFGDMQGY